MIKKTTLIIALALIGGAHSSTYAVQGGKLLSEECRHMRGNILYKLVYIVNGGKEAYIASTRLPDACKDLSPLETLRWLVENDTHIISCAGCRAYCSRTIEKVCRTRQQTQTTLPLPMVACAQELPPLITDEALIESAAGALPPSKRVCVATPTLPFPPVTSAPLLIANPLLLAQLEAFFSRQH